MRHSTVIGLENQVFEDVLNMRLEEAYVKIAELRYTNIFNMGQLFAKPVGDSFLVVRSALKELERFVWMPPNLLLDVSYSILSTLIDKFEIV